MKKSLWKSIGLLTALGLLLAAWGQPLSANEKIQFLTEQENYWAMYGRDYTNRRYSTLSQITPENVADLRVKFVHSLGTLRAAEATPIVIGNVMFLPSAEGPKTVFALNASNGDLLWEYEPEIPPGIEPTVCCDLGARGVAYTEGKDGKGRIIFGTLDARFIALDALTGKELWNVKVADYKDGIAITSPPIIVNNLAIIGHAGGEYGVRGSLNAFDVDTGKLVWRTYSIPGPGDKGHETWKGDSWKRGGGNMWLVGSYDAQLNLVYYGTSNPAPWDAAVRGPDTSNYGNMTNVGSSATIAFNPKTGEKVWQYQSTPHEAWDYDGVNELVLVDLDINGTQTPVALKADRNGFFYVINRATGKLISADPFVYQNWTRGVDMNSGRPIEVVDKRPTREHWAKNICPHLIGGKNWQSMAYNEDTGLVYMSTNNLCMDMKGKQEEYKRGVFWLGKEMAFLPGPGGFGGEFVAWDPVNRRRAWSVKSDLPYGGGAMTTASGLVFYGDSKGYFKALDANNGKLLWQIRGGSGIIAAPMTYSVEGNQYVAIVIGKNVTLANFMGPPGAMYQAATQPGGTMMVFGL